MLSSLKFCIGSVAKKDFIVDLKHFAIESGRVRGFNGMLALSTPIPFDIDCKPNAEQLIKAVSHCEETIQLSLTKAGRLSIKSGVYKAFIDCVDGDSVHVDPEGERVDFDGAVLMAGLQAVAPFVGSDASRPWANGVLVKGQSLFATNNVMLVEYWLADAFPIVVNLPKTAVREMLRIGEPPTHAQITETSATFHYTGSRWLRTQLYGTNWPDLTRIIHRESVQKPINPQIFDGLLAIKPFVDKLGTVYFRDGELCTHATEGEGATFAVEDFSSDGRYNIAMLQLLQGTATTIDWSAYPKPCAFMGDRLRGVVVGMRK